MVELGGLIDLLNADYAMPQGIACDMSEIAYDLKSKLASSFVGLYIGGCAVNGGAAARVFLQNLATKDSVSDIDYGIILSKDMYMKDRQILHYYIGDEIKKRGYQICATFNARNLYLIADSPRVMLQRINDEKTKPFLIAEKLLMAFGVIFPFNESFQIQAKVKDTLSLLKAGNPELKNEIVRQMNEILTQRRKIKEKHVPNSVTRGLLNAKRSPYSFAF